MSGDRWKDKEFLKWAKIQRGFCCVCIMVNGESRQSKELHHFDYRNRGMGMKGRDHWCARLCLDHHRILQGKGRKWFVANDQLETWTAMLEDSMNLLSDYILEQNMRDMNGMKK
jgi:hypothetical protein